MSNDRTFHETRTTLLTQIADITKFASCRVASKLTPAELAELHRIVHLGCCHVPDQAMAQRLADFKLVRANGTLQGKICNAWIAEPWGKLVVQAAKEGAQ